MSTTPGGNATPAQTAAPGPATAPVPPGHYEIDPAASAVTFRTRHLFGLAPVRGRFTVRSGAVDVADPVTSSGISAEIDAASFRTGHGQRDTSVRSARFLDVGRYPVITFRAERVDGASVAGTLTVRDVTRPVTVLIERVSAAAGSFTACVSTRIDRADFGVTAARGLAARGLEITAEVRCVRK
jgi:polyisoprenoid-binding protein YceI